MAFEKFSDRLKYLIEINNKKAARVSVELGLGKSTIGNYLNESREYPAGDVLIKLSEYFNVSIDWLLTGQNSDTIYPTEFAPTIKRLTGLDDKGRTKLLSMIEGFLQAHDK